MEIFVTVKLGAKIEKIEEVNENAFIVYVKAPAKEGRANDALIKVIARHFGVAQSAVKILSGHTSRKKLIQILL